MHLFSQLMMASLIVISQKKRKTPGNIQQHQQTTKKKLKLAIDKFFLNYEVHVDCTM